jgi:hypothetical protein
MALIPLIALLALAETGTDPGPADVWSSGGQLGLESRVFPDDDDPVTREYAVAMLGRLELRYRRSMFEAKARGFGRLDGFDSERSRLIAEESWVQVQSQRLRLRLGLDILNWSASEAFHPADVINARNLDSDLENFEKLGEPLAALRVQARDSTTVELLFMPVHTETRFPSPRSRLSFAPAGVDLRGRRVLIDRRGRITDSHFGPQAAMQLRQVLGPAAGVHHPWPQAHRPPDRDR